MRGGELFKLARERRESEDQILDSVRESVLAELEGMAQEAKDFIRMFEDRIAGISGKVRALVDTSAEASAKAGEKKLLEPGGRLPQGASLADMAELDKQLSAIVEGGRGRDLFAVAGSYAASEGGRPEIIAVRDGRD